MKERGISLSIQMKFINYGLFVSTLVSGSLLALNRILFLKNEGEQYYSSMVHNF